MNRNWGGILHSRFPRVTNTMHSHRTFFIPIIPPPKVATPQAQWTATANWTLRLELRSKHHSPRQLPASTARAAGPQYPRLHGSLVAPVQIQSQERKGQGQHCIKTPSQLHHAQTKSGACGGWVPSRGDALAPAWLRWVLPMQPKETPRSRHPFSASLPSTGARKQAAVR